MTAGKARLRIIYNVSLWFSDAHPKVGIAATAARLGADPMKTVPRSEALQSAAP
jgi:hypothetical protein